MALTMSALYTVILNTHYVILNTHHVILNVVKNLLSGNTLSMLSFVGFKEIATSGRPSSQ